MSAAIATLLISGSTLLFLFVSFGLLGKGSNESLYKRINHWIDGQLVRFGLYLKKLHYKFGFYTIRLTLHYILHGFLKRLHVFLASVVKWVKGLERTNREKAQSFKKAKKDSESHLNKIAEHKRETSLTEEEKQTLKETKLIG